MIKGKPTFNRKNPEYFKPGKALIDHAHVIYINLDGFARYYLDEFYRRKGKANTNFGRLANDGVFFNELKNAMPSITNPCQNMILSGSTSIVTGNVYRYYDKKQNIVIQQKRENQAILISEAAVKAGLSTTSVAHYLTEKDLTNHDINRLYIRANNDLPVVISRGNLKYGDHFSRFEQLYKIIQKKPLLVDGQTFVFDQLPALIIFYADDLDGVGHNEISKYGYPLANTEKERMENIMQLLEEIDERIGNLIDICKAEGVFNDMTFFITTDHGMVPFGQEKRDTEDIYSYSKINHLFEAIKAFKPNANIEFLRPDEKASVETNVVCVGANLNTQFSFLEGITDSSLDALKEALIKLPFVGAVQTRNELIDAGYAVKDTDLVVSPNKRYFFAKNTDKALMVRAQHDSRIDLAAHVPGWIFGKGIKKFGDLNDLSYNYDFGTTMAAALGLILPNANGLVLDVFDRQ